MAHYMQFPLLLISDIDLAEPQCSFQYSPLNPVTDITVNCVDMRLKASEKEHSKLRT